MDLSCSLDVLMPQDASVYRSQRHARLMAAAIRHTQEKIDAAFAGAPKVKAQRKVR